MLYDSFNRRWCTIELLRKAARPAHLVLSELFSKSLELPQVRFRSRYEDPKEAGFTGSLVTASESIEAVSRIAVFVSQLLVSMKNTNFQRPVERDKSQSG
ncbi:hypothetical protein P4S63_02145 [Pseudoalteromonas sp. B193]